jgi:AcrR family transcriptional regulator
VARELPEYHQQVAATNRAAILNSAMGLFLELGYDRTSLARVAQAAGVSRATLFKQFPTKAELFEAAVLAAGGSPENSPESDAVSPPTGDFHEGLVTLGLAYVELLTRPSMVGLMRVLIAESARFPELRERTFDFGTLPVLAALGRYLRAAHASGAVDIDDFDVASAQFLGMIASAVFWPRLVHGTWTISQKETRRAVEEAARTIAARYTKTLGP